MNANETTTTVATAEQLGITEKSYELFVALAKDAGNWNGTPLLGGNVKKDAAMRGNLTQLKREGLLTTESDEGNVWVYFTEKGQEQVDAIVAQARQTAKRAAEAVALYTTTTEEQEKAETLARWAEQDRVAAEAEQATTTPKTMTWDEAQEAIAADRRAMAAQLKAEFEAQLEAALARDEFKKAQVALAKAEAAERRAGERIAQAMMEMQYAEEEMRRARQETKETKEAMKALDDAAVRGTKVTRTA